ncbi:MAG TPA: hypothetical protein VKB80_34920 [Kofleriaceae bacterium]|nr:hypothetical protein [Kofleriaceae bacterium]
MRASVRLALSSLFVAALLTGCSSLGDDDEGGPGGGDGSGTDSPGGGDTGVGGGGDDGSGDGATADPIAGQYQLSSMMDLTSTSVADNLVPSAVSVLNQLAANPADTLINLLEAANIPIVDDLLGLLPLDLLDPFQNFVDEFILNRVVGGLALTQQLLGLVDEVTNVLTQFQLLTVLDLAHLDPGGGATSASHRLAGLSLPFRGQNIVVDTPDIVDQITAATGVGCSIALSGDEGHIEVGDHAFGLPLGDLVLDGLDQVLASGGSLSGLRDTLGALVGCSEMADEVSQKCLAAPLLCIGHRDEIEQFCEAGLDQVVAQLEDRVAAINFAEIRFQSGDADMLDSETASADDGIMDLLEQGSWQTVVFVDGVEVPFTAAFTGLRVTAAGATN